MEWKQGRLKEFTIKLEEITEIFVHKIGGKSYKIYFCSEVNGKMICYRNNSLPQDAKDDIEKSIKYFKEKNYRDLIYKGDTYYVTDKIVCYKYLDGDFIVAFYIELEDTDNELLKEYFMRQIKNYLLYAVPLIYYNENLYTDFWIESQINVITKTIVEEKINYLNLDKINLDRIKKVKFFTIIEKLSIMTYEGEYLKNKCLIFANTLDCDIEICNKINISDIKQVRKLLETTFIDSNGKIVGLLYDIVSGKLKGLISSDNIPSNCTKIIFQDKGKWSIVYNNNELTIIDSNVHFLNKEINKDIFIEIVNKEFKIKNADKIFDLVNKARQQKHGTMIVVSDCAEQEMERLGETGYKVKYNKNENRYIEQITAIDGAVLVNPNGEILGIGVILDGELFDECDIKNARGARYNSAIKYTYTRSKQGERCIAVVISEDGDINIIINGKEEHR